MNKEKAGIPKWLQNKLRAEGKGGLQAKVFQSQKPLRGNLKSQMMAKNVIEGPPVKKGNVRKVE